MFTHGLFGTRRASLAVLHGEVDFLAVYMREGCFHYDPKTWECESADLGVFGHISVTTNGIATRVKRFTMELRIVKDGKPQEPPTHLVYSKGKIGNFLYKYSNDSIDAHGHVVTEDSHEEMSDLAKKLRRTPAAETRTEGWVRFEVKKVKKELHEYDIQVFAVDVSDRRHQLETSRTLVPDLNLRKWIKPPSP